MTTRNLVVVSLLLTATLLAAVASVGRAGLVETACVLASCLAGLAVVLAIRNSQRLRRLDLTVRTAARESALWGVNELVAKDQLEQRLGHLGLPVTSYSIRFSNLQMIVREIDERRPAVILELGCGLSTLAMARLAAENGGMKIYSVDHEADWLQLTRREIERNSLQSWVQFVEAPLRSTAYGQSTVQFYDTQVIKAALSEKVDFLLVDGPPAAASANRLSRGPALPDLSEVLSASAVVAFDDADKDFSRKILRSWSESPGAELRTWESMTGLAFIELKSGHTP